MLFIHEFCSMLAKPVRSISSLRTHHSSQSIIDYKKNIIADSLFFIKIPKMHPETSRNS